MNWLSIPTVMNSRIVDTCDDVPIHRAMFGLIHTLNDQLILYLQGHNETHHYSAFLGYCFEWLVTMDALLIFHDIAVKGNYRS